MQAWLQPFSLASNPVTLLSIYHALTRHRCYCPYSLPRVRPLTHLSLHPFHQTLSPLLTDCLTCSLHGLIYKVSPTGTQLATYQAPSIPSYFSDFVFPGGSIVVEEGGGVLYFALDIRIFRLKLADLSLDAVLTDPAYSFSPAAMGVPTLSSDLSQIFFYNGGECQ